MRTPPEVAPGAARPGPAVEPSRILVIDDDGPTRELLTEVLTRDGHVVVAESTGIGGRNRAIAESFDLILSDIGLPDVDGIQLIQQLRAASVVTPIIALSGRTAERDRQIGRAAGYDDYLFKPIKASVLRAEVGRRLSEPRVAAAWLGGATAVEDAAAASSASAPVAAPAPVLARPRPRGVLGGLVVIAMGIPFVLQQLGVPNAASYLFVTMGAAFLTSYLRGRQYVYLIPTVTLSSFGVALLLPTWFVMRADVVAPAFVGTVALGFAVAFAVAPRKRWPLVPGVLLGAAALTRLLTGSSLLPSNLEPFLVPVALVAVGCYLLIDQTT